MLALWRKFKIGRVAFEMPIIRPPVAMNSVSVSNLQRPPQIIEVLGDAWTENVSLNLLSFTAQIPNNSE